MTVLIQPAFGNPDARRHWADTIEQEVRFDSPARDSTLLPAQRGQLRAMHPDGGAHFWGATLNQDKKMDTVRSGDVVLFTGRSQVRGIGEIGAVFRNAAFADTLWNPHPDRGSWHNVYSLLTFQPTAIPYKPLQEALGSDSGDNFMGLRLVKDAREPLVLEAMGVTTVTAQRREAQRLGATLETLLRDVGADQLVPPERMIAESTTYTRSATEVLVRRVESALVDAYLQQLPAGTAPAQRIRCSAGLPDLFIQGPSGEALLIEAKSQSSHQYVREGLGQILDYAHSVQRTMDALAVLLPEAPRAEDLALLHHYGIDCVYRQKTDTFVRQPCPTSNRQHWRR